MNDNGNEEVAKISALSHFGVVAVDTIRSCSGRYTSERRLSALSVTEFGRVLIADELLFDAQHGHVRYTDSQGFPEPSRMIRDMSCSATVR